MGTGWRRVSLGWGLLRRGQDLNKRPYRLCDAGGLPVGCTGLVLLSFGVAFWSAGAGEERKQSQSEREVEEVGLTEKAEAALSIRCID